MSRCIMEVLAFTLFNLLLAVILISLEFLGISAQLGCRICRNALALEDCVETQICSHNEECYTKQILTSQLQIVYNACCRAGTVCVAASSTPVGKRIETGHIGCSHCCNTSSTSSSLECNTQLCGLKLRNSYSTHCYYCGNHGAIHGAVTNSRHCQYIKLCADDEFCSVKTVATAGKITHEFGCGPRLFCRVTTQTSVGVSTYSFVCSQRLACQVVTIVSLENEGITTGVDLALLASSGAIVGQKRQTDICDVCCGDGRCNDDGCDSVRTRLAQFAKAGRFNYTSLRII